MRRQTSSHGATGSALSPRAPESLNALVMHDGVDLNADTAESQAYVRGVVERGEAA